MPKARKGAGAPGPGFWIFMAVCALGAIALVALLIGGEIRGARVSPDIVHKSD